MRNLYTCASYDPYSGRTRARKIGLAHKDVIDYKATLMVKENKKTDRLEVSDVSENRPRDELWCDSILAATGPLGEIASEIGKTTQRERCCMCLNSLMDFSASGKRTPNSSRRQSVTNAVLLREKRLGG